MNIIFNNVVLNGRKKRWKFWSLVKMVFKSDFIAGNKRHFVFVLLIYNMLFAIAKLAFFLSNQKKVWIKSQMENSRQKLQTERIIFLMNLLTSLLESRTEQTEIREIWLEFRISVTLLPLQVKRFFFLFPGRICLKLLRRR